MDRFKTKIVCTIGPATRDPETLTRIAAGLGSDIPFFLQDGPAIGTGRGEQIQPVEPFELLYVDWRAKWNQPWDFARCTSRSMT